MSRNIEIVQSYFNAIAAGDFQTVGALLSENVVWHQPGNGIQSGTYTGRTDVFAHLGNFMAWSNGTFAIDKIEYISDNGQLVTASINFKAEKGDQSISMKGIDLLRVEGDLIVEVWLFSEKIEAEDEFWTYAARS
jgi:ketosteroid isomerase-like protein